MAFLSSRLLPHAMRRRSGGGSTLVASLLALLLAACAPAGDAEAGSPDAASQEGWAPPLPVTEYSVADSIWGDLPDDRSYGAVSAIYPAPDGMSIWVAERCGSNLCVESDVDPVLRYDLDGNLMTSRS